MENKQATQSNLFTPTALQLQQLPQDEDTAIQLYKKIGRTEKPCWEFIASATQNSSHTAKVPTARQKKTRSESGTE